MTPACINTYVLYPANALATLLRCCRKEFEQKQQRKAGDGSVRRWAEFNQVNAAAVHSCTDAAERYGPYP
jgi:hypothetical protein